MENQSHIQKKVIVIMKNIYKNTPAIVVANHIIIWHITHKIPITALRAIKLTYIANGFHLALFGCPIFKESVQAWKHGVIIPSVYSAFKHYRYNIIDEPFKFAESIDNNVLIDLLDKVCNTFAKWCDETLSIYCNEPTWAKSMSSNLEINISNELICNEFKRKINQNN